MPKKEIWSEIWSTNIFKPYSMLNCGSACRSMSLCYFALASGQVVESL